MYFLIHRDLRQNTLIRRLLIYYNIGLLVFLGLSPIYERTQIGLWPNDILVTLKGSAELFILARSLADVLTDIHIKLFLNSLIAVMLSAILLRALVGERARGFYIATFLLFALPVVEALSLLALVYFGGPWATLKALSFAGLWLTQTITSLYLLVFLLRKP